MRKNGINRLYDLFFPVFEIIRIKVTENLTLRYRLIIKLRIHLRDAAIVAY